MPECGQPVRGRKRVAIYAPVPAPYRAYECDYLHRKLDEAYELRLVLMEGAFNQMAWQDALPREMPSHVLPPSRLKALLKKLPGCSRLNRRVWHDLSSFNPHAVILQGYDAVTLWIAFLWARLHRRPVLFRSDSNIVKEQNRKLSPLTRSMKRAFVGAMLSRVSAFLTIGTANEEYYKLYGGSPDRFFRASFVVENELFQRRADEERAAGQPLKRQLKIKQPKVLMFVGRLVPVKDPLTLIGAFAKARERIGHCCLAIVGSGPMEAEMREAARQSGLDDTVHFLGFRQPAEVASLYGIADAFVLPSLREPWGLVVNEAMAAGLPIIASDRVGAARDLVKEGQNGAVFRAGDADDLAGAIGRVLGDAATAAAMGQASRRMIYEWDERYEISAGYARALDFALGASRGAGVDGSERA